MATSYSNNGGSGDRRSVILTTSDIGIGAGTIYHLINGSFSDTFWFSGGTVVNKYIKFEFPIAVIIDESKFYQGSGNYSHGIWKWQGSNNGSDWTDIGSTFVLGGVDTQTITTLNGNTTAYKYYQLLGISGNTSGSPYVYEFEFKIDSKTTSYLAPLGMGDRTSSITVTSTFDYRNPLSYIINGLNDWTLWFAVEAASGKYIKFDFGNGNLPIINEIKWAQYNTKTHGYFKWQGSNNDSDWTDIGNSFILGGVLLQTQTELNGNTTGFRYYRLLGVSGNIEDPYIEEIYFSIVEDNSIITLKYRTGATSELCAAATYIEYTEPFDSEGFVQLRVEG